MNLWRLTKYPSLDGEGGRRYPGRWNSGGAPVVYLADSPPGALIEILVHLEGRRGMLPPSYSLLHVIADDNLEITQLQPAINDKWKMNDATTQKAGDQWLQLRTSALARVPSAILPHTWNYLLNPLHPDARSVFLTDTEQVDLDIRLLN